MKYADTAAEAFNKPAYILIVSRAFPFGNSAPTERAILEFSHSFPPPSIFAPQLGQ